MSDTKMKTKEEIEAKIKELGEKPCQSLGELEEVTIWIDALEWVLNEEE